MTGKYAQSADKMDVAYVAHLARMHLSKEEIALFQGQLDQILEYVRQLQELDVEGVEPTAHATRVENVFRKDESRPGLDHDTALANAPAQSGGQFVVPKIIE